MSCSKGWRHEGWLDVAKRYAEHLSRCVGNKEYTDDDETHMWKLYVKLKRYLRVPQILEKEGRKFVARCDVCKNKEKRYQKVCRRCTLFKEFCPQDDESCRPQKWRRLKSEQRQGKISTTFQSPPKSCERCEEFEKVTDIFPPYYPEIGKYEVSLDVKCTQCDAKRVLVRYPKGELLELPSSPKSPAEELERKAPTEWEAELERLPNNRIKFSAENLKKIEKTVAKYVVMDEDTLTSDSEDDFRFW